MRFLGVGEGCELGALYLRLLDEGHEVKVAISEPYSHDTLAGMIERVDDWKTHLPWVKEKGADGIILFENANEGAIQDELRGQGFNVIGGSAFGDRLENDRAYAQSILGDLGFKTAAVHKFSDFTSAARFIDNHPARYVLKFNGSHFVSSDNYVGWSPSGADTKAVLKGKLQRSKGKDVSFVLMQHVDGIEMGVGAYFDGEKFVGAACLDWEHKRLFPGDLGELTGEMGTVVTYQGTGRFFARTLAKMQPLLQQHSYCGYINLNTMVNSEGIWPLEFTCQFGYPGFAVLTPLQQTPWSELFKALVTRKGNFLTREGFCVGIVLTTPPFPYDRAVTGDEVGAPVVISEPLDDADRSHIHYGEVGLADGELVTSGYAGWTMVVTGAGPTIDRARQDALALTRRVHVPNLRYRTDIGAKLAGGDFRQLVQWDMFGVDET